MTAASPGRLRVATLNIWHQSADWPSRAAATSSWLNRIRPDLVGLQEVAALPDGTATQVDSLAEPAGMRVTFGPSHQGAGPDGAERGFGNALLSRYPVLRQECVPLPDVDGDEPRSVLFCLVDAPCGLVPVFVTHLAWRLDAGAGRVRQVRRLVEVMAELAPLSAEDAAPQAFPAILLGDLNAEPDSDELRFLTGLAVVDGVSVRFADAWRYGGRGPGYTYDPANPHAAGGHEHARRIDYILVRGPAEDGRGRPESPRLAFHRPVGSTFPSDHFGVLADLAAGRPEQEAP